MDYGLDVEIRERESRGKGWMKKVEGKGSSIMDRGSLKVNRKAVCLGASIFFYLQVNVKVPNTYITFHIISQKQKNGKKYIYISSVCTYRDCHEIV